MVENALLGEIVNKWSGKKVESIDTYIVAGLDVAFPSQLSRIDVEVPGRLRVNCVRCVRFLRSSGAASLEHGNEILGVVLGVKVLRLDTPGSRGCIARVRRWTACYEDVALDCSRKCTE